MQHDRDRIFNLLEAGHISAAEAEMLIDALGGNSNPEPRPSLQSPASAPVPSSVEGTPARSLQIRVYQPTGQKNINVTVPLALLKFAARFIPNEAMYELADAGVNLDEIMERVLAGDLVAGEILTAVANENGTPTHIEIRVA